jgi:hypothetical protein
MVRVELGKSLRAVDLGLLLSLSFRELLNYISGGDADLSEVKRLVGTVNEEFKMRNLHIQVRRAAPWDSKADYRLVLIGRAYIPGRR